MTKQELLWLAKQNAAPFSPLWKIVLKTLWGLSPPIVLALICLHSGYVGPLLWGALGIALVYAFVLSVLCMLQRELIDYCKKFHGPKEPTP